MTDYFEIRFTLTPCSEDMTDYLAALLADVGFESFVPDETGVTAYVRTDDYDDAAVADALSQMPDDIAITTDKVFVEGQDWNEEWEKHYFKPIVIGDKCVVHSSFHTDIPAAQYDIVIDPKMAFGTGHHATTSLIVEQLLARDLNGKTVIDMGTGTGILAILAAMRGAHPVTGIEIDSAAYDNACENIRLNGHEEIHLINGDASALANCPKADLFIANINLNVITGDLPRYVAAMKPGADVLFSGFYSTDVPKIMSVAEPLGLEQIGYTVKGDNWTCLHLKLK